MFSTWKQLHTMIMDQQLVNKVNASNADVFRIYRTSMSLEESYIPSYKRYIVRGKTRKKVITDN